METTSTQDPSRRHTCTYCNRGFRKPEHLRRHTRIHTKEKPYGCHCGSSFSRRDLLLRHERLAHQNSQPPAVSPGTMVVASAPTAITATTAPPDQDSLEIQSITVNLPTEAAVPQPFTNTVARSSLSIPRHTEDHPLYDFNNFLGNSGLMHLVNGPADNGTGETDTVHPVDTPQPVYSPIPAPSLQNTRDPGIASLAPAVAAREPGAQLTGKSSAYPTITTTADINDNIKDSIMSDPSMPQFMALNPDFSLPSSQTTGRYLKSFFQNFKFPVIHAQSIQSDSTSAVLGLAMLALGGRSLLETQNASSLFNASRSMAIKHWTSSALDQPQDSRRPGSQLTVTFLLLLEYVNLEQAPNFVRDMSVLQSGLIFHLSISWDDISHSSETERCFAQWVQAETKRRAQIFGYCTSVLNAFLFDFLAPLPKPSPHLQLPCSPDAWASSTLEEFEQLEETLQSRHTNHLFPWFDSLLSRVDAATEPQIDVSALQFSYFIAALLSRRITLLGDSSFFASSTSLIEQQRQLIAKIITHYVLALQNCKPSNEMPNRLIKTTAALFRLLQVRLAFNFSLDVGLESLYSKSPRQLARTIYELPGPRPVSPDILISALHYSIDVLEEPATTGIPFFVRSRTSCWGVEELISTFEFVLLLCKWLCHGSIATTGSQDEPELIQRLRALLPSAWSSIDGVNDLSPNLDGKDLAFVLVRFWAQVFEAPENKHFARLLGQSLSEYAGMMEHSDSLG